MRCYDTVRIGARRHHELWISTSRTIQPAMSPTRPTAAPSWPKTVAARRWPARYRLEQASEEQLAHQDATTLIRPSPT